MPPELFLQVASLIMTAAYASAPQECDMVKMDNFQLSLLGTDLLLQTVLNAKI
jgi:hypothetical protein